MPALLQRQGPLLVPLPDGHRLAFFVFPLPVMPCNSGNAGLTGIRSSTAFCASEKHVKVTSVQGVLCET